MSHDTSSDSENEIIHTRAKLFGNEKPIHEVLGGGKGTMHFKFQFHSLLVISCYICNFHVRYGKAHILK